MFKSQRLLKPVIGFSLWSCCVPLLNAAEISGSEIKPALVEGTFDIRQYRQATDDPDLDTGAINRAIAACAAAGGGQVLIPPGRYVSGTIHLKSHVTFFLAAGATLVGTTNLNGMLPESSAKAVYVVGLVWPTLVLPDHVNEGGSLKSSW